MSRLVNNFEPYKYSSKKMRRSLSMCRASKGYSWYNKFMKEGNKGFKKFAPPTAFDWDAPITQDAINANKVTARPKAFFELYQDEDPFGRVEIELAEDIVPKTVDNFRRLVEGQGVKHNKGYKNTIIHAVQKGNCVLGGDIENNDGTGNHSAGEERYIKDENYIIPHSERGLVSMGSIGLHTGGSQFMFTLQEENRHLNGRNVVFGRIVKGQDILDQLEGLFTTRLKPARDIIIKDCGIVN